MNANEIKNDLMCRPDFSQTGVSFTIADTIVPCWEWERAVTGGGAACTVWGYVNTFQTNLICCTHTYTLPCTYVHVHTHTRTRTRTHMKEDAGEGRRWRVHTSVITRLARLHTRGKFIDGSPY